jgi:hypothetical protein
MSKFTTYQLGEIYKSVSTTTAGTPVNSNGINLLNSLLIPANTFAAGDIITIQGMVSKDNAGSTYVPYFYWNTSASLVGAILIATGVAGATTGRNIMLYRRLHILTANGTGNASYVFSTTDSANSDLNFMGGAGSTLAINWTSAGYIILAGSRISSLDTLSGQWIKVSNF